MPLHAQRLHQVIDASGADALDVRLLDHRHQCPLGAPPRLEQARKEAPIADPRHLQLDRAHARIPRSLAVPIAVPAALSCALVPLRAEVLATSISINSSARTRTPSRRKSPAPRSPCATPRRVPFSTRRPSVWLLLILISTIAMRTTRWPSASTAWTFTHPWGHYLFTREGEMQLRTRPPGGELPGGRE